MDQIDYSILNILKHNARETASNISKEVGRKRNLQSTDRAAAGG